jgi:methionyl-tRNA formyltransferase
MKICFAGTPAVAVPALRALAASDHEVAAVITRPDAAAGRGRHVQASPVAQAAEALHLPVWKPQRPGDLDFQAQLAALAPDAVAVVAYGALLPDELLALPPYGWINLHFSLLPAWRGAAPVARSILAGDTMTGATTFRIVHDLDAGPVYGTMTYAIGARATAGQVLEDLAEVGAPLLVGTFDVIETGLAEAVPQGPSSTPYAAKLTVDDARVRWDEPALAVDRRIRACTPDPGAWTTWRGQRLKLGVPAAAPGQAPADVAPPPHPLAPGELWATKHAVWAGTKTEPLLLGTVQRAGKPQWSDAAAWARGAQLEPGLRLGEE